MKFNTLKLLLVFTFVFLCAISVFGQESSTCPEIKIKEPPSVVTPGQNLEFSVLISSGSTKKLSYTWSVDKGNIIEGQGTDAISVNTSGYSKDKIFAAVKILGLASDCISEAKGFGVVYAVGSPLLADEFGAISDGDVRARFKFVISELKDKDLDAYVINFGSMSEVEQRERLLKTIWKSTKFDSSRISFYWGGEESVIRTRVYFFPNVSDFPGREGQDTRQETQDMIAKIWIPRDKSFVPCPSLSVIQPKPVDESDENAIFIANVVSDFEYENLGFVWNVDQGVIIKGQGTKTITVSKRGAFRSVMTATVFLSGLPNRCLHPAVGTAPTFWRPSKPALFDEISPNESRNLESKINKYAAELKILSDYQGYIINYGKPSEVQKQEEMISDLLNEKYGIDKSRTVFLNGGKKETNITQLWILPTGANASSIGIVPTNSTISSCPSSITVVDSPVAVSVGENITFTVNIVSGIEYENLGYRWTTDKGEIVDGQGTPTVTVSTKGRSETSTNATVTVTGLPKHCFNSASGSTFIHVTPSPKFLEEIGIVSKDLLERAIESFSKRLKDDPNAAGYIVNYGNPKDVKNREKIIRDTLIRLSKVDSQRIVFVKGGNEKTIRTTLWIVPAGADASLILEESKKVSSACPRSISVVEATPPVAPEKDRIFIANVESENPLKKTEYVWIVKNGKIIKGKGTRVITVSIKGYEGMTTEAILKILGLPKGCPNEAYASGRVSH